MTQTDAIAPYLMWKCARLSKFEILEILITTFLSTEIRKLNQG